MDSGTISQLVFFIFGAAILIYGLILYKDLARLRDANDRDKAKLNALVREQNARRTEPADNSAEIPITDRQQRLSSQAESFNQSVRQYNARIGQFPEAIVAAIVGLHRRVLFSVNKDTDPKT